MCDGINDCPTVDEDYCSDESEDEDNSTNDIASKNECPCESFTLCVFFSDGDCDSSGHNKWVTQNNLTSSSTVYCKQKQIAVSNRTL